MTTAVTAYAMKAPLLRVEVQPNERNGLRSECSHMADKVTIVPRERLGSRLGRLDDEDVLRLNQALLVFLGVARSTRAAL